MGKLRLEVTEKIKNQRYDKWCDEINKYLNIPISDITCSTFYKVESKNLDDKELFKIINKNESDIFYDPILQSIHYQISTNDTDKNLVVEISYKAGVTDNSANSASEALKLIDLNCKVATGKIFFLEGDIDIKSGEKIGLEFLGNPLIQEIMVFNGNDFLKSNRFNKILFPKVNLEETYEVKEINLLVSDNELEKISSDRCLALTISEMKHIKDFFYSDNIQKVRRERSLPLNPTDIEIEVIAQTWSEHCKHKIFSSNIKFKSNTNSKDSLALDFTTITGLYKTYIKGLTRKLIDEKRVNYAISVFDDNAGIVRFDDQIDLCIKVETHNSPSALDPYGGAITGILGVNRDILGCGMGAKPIANTDVFCFASPKLNETELNDLPRDLKHPRRILDGVHKGIEDGGNKSGIPTVNGAFYFDQSFAGKPLVFCGTVGTIPRTIGENIDASKKHTEVGDLIVMIGGLIGVDGIHGATFSSLELNESSPSSAVQIGDPLTQKRVLDFLMEARDKSLFSGITDNGAGGLSSSIGEMALETGGAELDLSLCPVKYQGLNPYELMISESQERMSLAVNEDTIDNLLALSKKHGVVSTVIGKFTNSKKLSIYHNKELIGELPLNFLHNSLPPMKLNAIWDGPRLQNNWTKRKPKKEFKNTPKGYQEAILKLLETDNIVSKENLVRQYDHEVLGATHIKPFMGKNSDGPCDSGVVWLYPHGGEKNSAISIGCGLNPRVSMHDPFLMAQMAVDEAFRNIVATGGDPEHCCLLDNFCWPDPVKSLKNPDGDYKLGQLVRTCQGLYDICLEYGAPLVSGKDSMKNDYRGKRESGEEVTISVLPTLLVTAMAKSDIRYSTTSDFKNENSLIYQIGIQESGLKASEFSEIYNLTGSKYDNLPTISIKENHSIYKKIHSCMRQNLIESCHDISDGGSIISICEASIGGEVGALISLEKLDTALFSEAPGRFIVSINPNDKNSFEAQFEAKELSILGRTTNTKTVQIKSDNLDDFEISIDKLNTHWKKEL